ncbi:tetratricopeptide repeat protein [Candidatus Fermentibacteria bacterium]|nr:tetratricopeptide repeat protein [Candidatus Fermentibacteria bacterium]
MKRAQMVTSPRIVGILAALLVLLAAVWFRAGIYRAAVWESEMAVVAEAGRVPADGPHLPHLEYQSPAHRALLRITDAEGAAIMRARNVSWVLAVAAVGAMVAAGWSLFSPLEGLAAGCVALGSLRVLQAAQSATPDASLILWYAVTAAIFGAALRTSSWPVWISLGVSGLVAALLGFQSIPLLIAIAAIGGALISQRTHRDGTELEPPVWQYVAAVPVPVAAGALWSITWVLASRDANPIIAKAPRMSLQYLEFLHRYLFGHAGWGVWILGIVSLLGIIGSLRKRVTKVDDLRRVYVDKRSRRPMVFLLLWLAVGIPAINLLLFNARRPQDPATLNSLFVPLALVAARGLALLAEIVVNGTRRLAGVRIHMLPAVVVIAVAVGWFGQATARRSYAGYRMTPSHENAWSQAIDFLAPRSLLGRAATLAPPWAAGLIRAHLGQALSGVDVVVPALGSEVDSLVRSTPACWAVLYQSDLYATVPERIRSSIDRNFEELQRFPTPWGGVVMIMATPWLRASESQWSFEQERLALGDDQGNEALVAMARLYLDAGRPDSAKTALAEALIRSPANVHALMQMAQIAEREGDDEGAAAWYGKAARADSSDPRPYFEHGRLMAQAGRLQTAAASLERALALENRHVPAAQLLSRVYDDLGRTEDASGMEQRLQGMSGSAILDFEFGRVLAVRSAELPTMTWAPGEEVSILLSWETLRSSSTGIMPTLVVESETSSPMLRPPPGGWTLSLPDSGFEAGLSGTDSLSVHFLYRDLPQLYPDIVQISLKLLDTAGIPLSISTTRGDQLTTASLARLVAWRASSQRRVTVEAEEMDQHPGFPVPGGINVGDAGLTHGFRFPGGPVAFEVVARGTPAAGQWPKMIIEIAGQVVRELDVPDREWRTYTVSATVPPGLRIVRMKFPNDYVNQATGEDRNLVIDKVTLVEEEIRFRLEAP